MRRLDAPNLKEEGLVCLAMLILLVLAMLVLLVLIVVLAMRSGRENKNNGFWTSSDLLVQDAKPVTIIGLRYPSLAVNKVRSGINCVRI